MWVARVAESENSADIEREDFVYQNLGADCQVCA